MHTVGRKASVELRKLLFDDRPLVHHVLHRPRFHPLSNTGSLAGDIYENAFSIQLAPATADGSLLGPVARHSWRVVVHPLHGLKFNKTEKKWVFAAPFDTRAQRMALGPWLKQRLFRVNEREYSLLDTLKFVAVKEGAHVDLRKNVAAGDMERVHFPGYMTYPHIVTTMVASYLLEQYRASYRTDKGKWDTFRHFSDRGVADYKVVRGGEFVADVVPLGLEGEFHETGIQIPEPGRLWKPEQIAETTIVRA